MTAGAPWSVKGIDPKAREVAKDLARRQGMTLGEWLNNVIISGEDDSGETPRERRPDPEPAEPVRQSSAADAELAKVAGALERLTARIEAAEHRSSLAISGVDQSVQSVLARLAASEDQGAAVAERVEAVERDQRAVAARLDAALMAMRDDHEAAAERLRKIEEEGAGPRSAEALKSLETALGKIAGQLYEGEGKTRAVLGEIGREFDAMSRRLDRLDERPEPAAVVESLVGGIAERLERAEAQTFTAIKALEASFAGLDERLRAAESGPADDPSARFEQLAADLSARVDAARAELAEKLEGAADGRLDQMERVVRDLTGHVEAAERRSHQAVEKMGHEVLRIAGVINRRMQQVEDRTADAVEQVGGEVARVADAMEARLRASDNAHGEALERLGDEIARISERLAERIAASERRSAQAIDDVGEQVGRVAEKISQRYDRAANELSDRIKQSEERTARFLEEARERIDQRLTETSRRIAEQVSPVQQGFVDFQARLDQIEATASHMPPFGKTAALSADPPDVFTDRGPTRATAKAAGPVASTITSFPAPPVTEPSAAPAPARREEPSPFAGFDDAEDPFEPLDDFDPQDMAPAAARAEPSPAGSPFAARPHDGPEFSDAEMFEPAPSAPPPAFDGPLSTKDLLERARAAARASAAAAPAAPVTRPSIFAGLKLPGRKDKPAARRSSTLRTALMVSATAAALSVFGASYVIFAQEGPKADAGDLAERRSPAASDAEGEFTPQLASLTVEPQEAAVVAPSADGDAAASAYAAAAAALEEGRKAEGLAGLRKAADLGHAPAQLHLANLYATGENGVERNPAEARRWTERAAQGGDKRAMHNLGLLYFEGDGGPKNVTLAAQWFRRAAEAGLTDSQYNLGLVHEKGYGVTQNAAEAYKWYIVAARNGDTEARTAAERLEKTLSDESRAAAERSALAFRAAGADAVQMAGALSPGVTADVAAAQRALSALGYYQGPSDGRTSPALRAAVTQWQQDTGRPADGVIDADVVSGLAAG